MHLKCCPNEQQSVIIYLTSIKINPKTVKVRSRVTAAVGRKPLGEAETLRAAQPTSPSNAREVNNTFNHKIHQNVIENSIFEIRLFFNGQIMKNIALTFIQICQTICQNSTKINDFDMYNVNRHYSHTAIHGLLGSMGSKFRRLFRVLCVCVCVCLLLLNNNGF